MPQRCPIEMGPKHSKICRKLHTCMSVYLLLKLKSNYSYPYELAVTLGLYWVGIQWGQSYLMGRS